MVLQTGGNRTESLHEHQQRSMNDRQGNNNKTCQTSWCHQKTCGELSVPPSASARICFDHLGSKCPRAWRPLSGEGKGRRINLFVKQWMLQERQTISPLFLFRGFDLTVTSSNVLVLRLRTKTKPRCFRRLLRKSHDTSLPQDPAWQWQGNSRMSWRQRQFLVWQKIGMAGHSSNVFFLKTTNWR